jgi:hypothetical protein
MIKKLRNQPCAPKVGASSQMGAKRKKNKIKLEQLKYYINPKCFYVFFQQNRILVRNRREIADI